ncbi:substrate-binding domain-containing protein [Devosia sp. A16]|uniref:substrate-binding domain-containing protein n=1 Tax=Devosia sp. A16 TaxID=1736675 RepID=UPI0006D7CE52|nr:substrate-binding domain-containing protein [Devosia sp. A16]
MLAKSMLLGLAAGFALVTSAIAADPVKIVYIGKNTGNPYFDSITGGFEDACKALGCEFEFVAPATAEATSQIPFIEAQIQRGVNVIGIAPNSPDALNQVLDDARAKGILVLTVNGDLVGNESHRDATILPVDFTKTGPNQVELMGSMIDYKGEIAILSATTEAPDQNTWIAAMNDTLKNDAKYKDMKLVATVYGDDQPEKSTTEMEALLSNYPDLVGVIAPTTVGVAAAAQVVQSRGIADKVHVTGLGLPSEMRDFVKDGTVKAFQLWSPYNEGWLAAHFALGVLDGSIKNEVGNTFEVPNLGTITINDKNAMNTQAELTTFDASNIDDFNF